MAWRDGTAADALAWAAPLAALAAKALLEERGIGAAYCAGSRRFVPGVW